ncbi:MAG: exo-alpha-sialidase [Planctomycetes bacterium]|nr:exo-alpha-sialidase [Planctomycetota bacterium]
MRLMSDLCRMMAILAVFAVAIEAQAGENETPATVRTMRLPEGGIQPQVVADENDVIHMIYFLGHPRAGDVFYMSSTNGGESFSDPIRVNSQKDSTTIGAHLAIGKNGRAHVAWNGSHLAEPKAPSDMPPLLYARMNDEGTGFEEQQNVIREHPHLDGGSSLAADRNGNVFVIWHAPIVGGHGEQDRRVWVARSTDEGKTFETEIIASDVPTGACGCCALKSFADSEGTLYTMYRTASKVVNRDMHMLVSRDAGNSFTNEKMHEWNVGQCVMSTADFIETDDDVYAAWETKMQVYFGKFDPATGNVAERIAAPGKGKMRKHPCLATSLDGQVLLVWTEGLSWGRGGSVAWQIFDNDGKPLLEENGGEDGVPKFSLVASFATPEGFTIVY